MLDEDFYVTCDVNICIVPMGNFTSHVTQKCSGNMQLNLPIDTVAGTIMGAEPIQLQGHSKQFKISTLYAYIILFVFITEKELFCFMQSQRTQLFEYQVDQKEGANVEILCLTILSIFKTLFVECKKLSFFCKSIQFHSKLDVLYTHKKS